MRRAEIAGLDRPIDSIAHHGANKRCNVTLGLGGLQRKYLENSREMVQTP